MLFNSLVFLGFISIVLLVYPRLRLRGQNLFLLVASYIFYGYWDWRFTFLLLASTVIDFWIGLRMHETSFPRKRKQLLILSMCLQLGMLGFFKYYNFFATSAALMLTRLGFQANMPLLKVILPVGISFYTFQTMSYVIDIYREKLEPTRNFIDFALFVSFFPQLVAGPIERATNLLPQVCGSRQVTRRQVMTGINLLLIGYFKKVVIADTLAPLVDQIFSAPLGMSSGQLLSGVLAFSMQIYGDFSGYSDIARGLARLLGFELMENFNAPYLSRNITEFWRRWHISLSTWLRDYLYISLGGNRLGLLRTYANLMITMLLGGLWHGAAWQFVAWGFLHGLYLIIHRLLQGGRAVSHPRPAAPIRWVIELAQIFGTFLLVSLTWVFFRAPSISSAFAYLHGIFRFDRITDFSPVVLLAGGLIMLLEVVQAATHSSTWLVDKLKPAVLRFGVAQLLLLGSVVAAIAHQNTVTPFIYFQF